MIGNFLRDVRRAGRLHLISMVVGGLIGAGLALGLMGPAPDPASAVPVPRLHPGAQTAVLQPPIKPDSATSADSQSVSPADDAATTINATPASVSRTVAITRGDTLMQVMVRAGTDRGDAHAAITALSDVYDPRRLMPGQEITLTFNGSGKNLRLVDVALNASAESDIIARRDDAGGFAAEAIKKELEQRAQRATGGIDDNLYMAAKRAGVPLPVLSELAQLYGFDVDFQRDIHAGDSFELFFDSFHDAEGSAVKYGPIRYARLSVQGTALRLYRFETADGFTDYFNEHGESVRKALMKTPINGARLSSRYGMRKHPILGYSRMHRGADFAAPTGTPVMAAGNGVIDYIGRKGAYGKYIRIRHNSTYKTAYAHLSKYARGLKRGKRVKQGQVIGYVGSTGRSTGPHLHYEVHRGGKQVNPLTLKLPSGKKLSGAELIAFNMARDNIEREMALAPVTRQVAQSE